LSFSIAADKYLTLIFKGDKNIKTVTFEKLEQMMSEILLSLGMSEENAKTVVDVYLEATKRGSGHHDISDFAWHVNGVRFSGIKANPEYKKLASFQGMESWDGDNGMGELICSFAMNRAIGLAKTHGIGFCAMRNSNHYLSSAAYTKLAAEAGCIGLIFAKGIPSMGMPGNKGPVIGQSPNGYAFPTNENWQVCLDGCLAYVSGHGELNKAVNEGRSIPSWWGVGPDGEPTDDPAKLLKGTRYPIGEHKGFGYAILCELLTGVMSGGLILDQKENDDGLKNITSHTAIAIKADALMTMDEYKNRSSELIDRIQDLSPGIRIPGRHSYDNKVKAEKENTVELDDYFMSLYEDCTEPDSGKRKFTGDTPLGMLLQSESASSIIKKIYPELIGYADAHEILKGYTLKMILTIANSSLESEKIKDCIAKLEALNEEN
jgi:LDH2 family malate/lactate/ureidoglycolate dehydrogenase